MSSYPLSLATLISYLNKAIVWDSRAHSLSIIMSPDGERTYLCDKQRDDQKKQLSKGVAKYCR